MGNESHRQKVYAFRAYFKPSGVLHAMRKFVLHTPLNPLCYARHKHGRVLHACHAIPDKYRPVTPNVSMTSSCAAVLKQVCVTTTYVFHWVSFHPAFSSTAPCTTQQW